MINIMQLLIYSFIFSFMVSFPVMVVMARGLFE